MNNARRKIPKRSNKTLTCSLWVAKMKTIRDKIFAANFLVGTSKSSTSTPMTFGTV